MVPLILGKLPISYNPDYKEPPKGTPDFGEAPKFCKPRRPCMAVWSMQGSEGVEAENEEAKWESGNP